MILALAESKINIYKEYRNYLSYKDVDVLPLEDFRAEDAYGLQLKEKEPHEFMKLSRITKVTYKKNEDILQKLTSVFNSAVSDDSGLVILVNSFPKKPTELYLGILSDKIADRRQFSQILEASINSNFPGTSLNNKVITKDILQELALTSSQKVNISTVSAIGSIRDKSKTEKKEFLQGFEKLLDTTQGLEYVGVFIARKVGDTAVTSIISDHEQL